MGKEERSMEGGKQEEESEKEREEEKVKKGNSKVKRPEKEKVTYKQTALVMNLMNRFLGMAKVKVSI